MPVSLNENKKSRYNLFNRHKTYYHISFIANMPLIDIDILAVMQDIHMNLV